MLFYLLRLLRRHAIAGKNSAAANVSAALKAAVPAAKAAGAAIAAGLPVKQNNFIKLFCA